MSAEDIVLAPLEQRVTIYYGGWHRIQATWVRVFRSPHAQYQDAFFVQSKPKGKRLLRQFIDSWRPSAIIMVGWHHPHVRPKILVPGDEPTLAPEASSMTIGGPADTDMNQIIDRYVRSLPREDVILDLRGQIVSTDRKWS